MLAVVAFAVVSVLCLFLAAREWGGSRAQAGDAASGTASTWPGGAILLVVSLVWLGGLWVTADLFGWNRDRTLWLGFAAYLALMTLFRPTWFWENYRARWLRGLVGDEGTALLYLLFAGLMIWIGLSTDWTFGGR
jgi:hypothetical protein